MSAGALKSLFPLLRLPLVINAVLIGSAIAVAWFAHGQFVQFQQARSAAAARVLEQLSSVQELRSQLDHAQKFSVRFAELDEMRILRPFEKQTVLDRFEAVLKADLVVPKSYALAAQAPVQVPGVPMLQSHTPVFHQAVFEVAAPHELDIVQVIDGIAPASDPMTTVEGCEIKAARAEGRIGVKSDSDGNTSVPLGLRCAVRWYRFVAKAPVADGAVLGGALPSPAPDLRAQATK